MICDVCLKEHETTIPYCEPCHEKEANGMVTRALARVAAYLRQRGLETEAKHIEDGRHLR